MEIVFESILSVSSEDQSHPASNLINHSIKREWLNSQPGEDAASVEIKLKDSTKIASIDIGNFGSAFITVEVGCTTKPNEWFAFLPSTKFMDSTDARNGIGVKKVLLFVYDQFHSSNRDKSWDKLRITCQQMFIKSRKYGLSFIVCRKEIPASRLVNKQAIMKQKEKEMIKSLSKKKEVKEPDVFDASHFIDRTLHSPKPTKPQKVNKINNESLKHNMANYSSPSRSKNTADTSLPIPKNQTASISSVTPKVKKVPQTPTSSKANGKRKLSSPDVSSSTPQRKKPAPSTDFRKILDGVIFTISGYVNPDRGRIRDTALKMGAKFERDITTSTTHLICAFINTPKYNQFLGRGKIMKKEWIFLQAETKRVNFLLNSP